MAGGSRFIRVATDDPDFLSDLQAAHIEGLSVSRRLEAAAGTPDVLLYAIDIAKAALPVAVPLFAQWLHHRYGQQKHGKTSIDGIVIPKGLKQTVVIIMGGEVAKNPQRRPRQKKKK
jgi:hypothetical protein